MVTKEPNWTPEQDCAMTINDNRILVSAAAGSGKSSVLAERIARKICTDKNYDLGRILVTSFTRESANSLRNKITERLNVKIAELNLKKGSVPKTENAPTDAEIYSQLLKLPSAMISTIHSACLTYVKRYFDKLGIPASVSVLDPDIAQALKKEVMEEFIEDCYAGKFPSIPDFNDFVKNFVTAKDDDLTENFLELYNKFEQLTKPMVTVDKANFATDGNAFLSSPFGELIIKRYRMELSYFIFSLEKAKKYAETGAYSKVYDTFNKAHCFAVTVDKALVAKDYNTVADWLSNKRGTVSNVKEKEDQGELYISDARALYYSAKKWYDTVFCFTNDNLKECAERSADISQKILDFLNGFKERFTNAKLAKFSIDFNDLEQYTLNLLYDENDNVTEIAKEISRSLVEIYVDECQDLSPVQAKIFEALSIHCPIYMVGDIKQAIYSFRGANSDTFAKYKRSFVEHKDFDTNKAHCGVTVFLSKNFRSTNKILNFANWVSDAMFYTPEQGNDDTLKSIFEKRIPYSKETDSLKYDTAKKEEKEVTILHCQASSKSSEFEEDVVVSEIEKLIKNGVSPSEIAILYRSGKEVENNYKKKLTKKNIPVFSKKGTPLLETPEVQLALCLLNCCDNPYRDIFLTGALRSPIFGFTFNELITVRRYAPKAPSLYAALCKYTEDKSFDKGRYFIDFLKKMREFAMNTTVDRLLWQIYTETSFFTAIYDGTVSENEANARRQNLISLYELSKQLSSSERNSLYSFLENLRLMIEQDSSPASASDTSDGVKIFTIHASKGLEFNYCFLINTDKGIAKTKGEILFDRTLGYITPLRDEKRISKFNTPFNIAIKTQLDYEALEEEMRLLYVALTRAANKLYITTSVKNLTEREAEANFLACEMHPYMYIRESLVGEKYSSRSNTYLKWILLGLKYAEKKPPEYSLITVTPETLLSEADTAISENAVSNTEKSDNYKALELLEARLHAAFLGKLPKGLEERLTPYKHAHSLFLPSKLSVSNLYPRILEEDAYYGKKDLFTEDGQKITIPESSDDLKKLPTLKIPDFVTKNTKATGADKGTATHVFMQFCDFELTEKNGVAAEIQRLCTEKFILEEHKALIDQSVIKSFLKSDIYSEMKNASELNREYRFNVKLPAGEFTENVEQKKALSGENIFVQGIIDCYFKDKNGAITLLDYKTDFVSADTRKSQDKENKFFIDRYKEQLQYYRKALEILTGKAVSKTVIYSFALGRCIEIK